MIRNNRRCQFLSVPCSDSGSYRACLGAGLHRGADGAHRNRQGGDAARQLSQRSGGRWHAGEIYRSIYPLSSSAFPSPARNSYRRTLPSTTRPPQALALSRPLAPSVTLVQLLPLPSPAGSGLVPTSGSERHPGAAAAHCRAASDPAAVPAPGPAHLGGLNQQ